MGHYATMCHRKKKKNVVAEVDDFSTKFEKEFYFVVNISTNVSSFILWYIDNGASCCMSSVSENYRDITNRGVDVEVVLGDDSIVKEDCIGIISFKSESQPPLIATKVLYVLGLRNNLMSVSTIEGKGYEVVFHDG